MNVADTVRLIPALAETPSPLPSLILATAEPPMGPESVVVDAHGATLAMAIDLGRGEDNRTRYGWAITGPGCQRIEREVMRAS